MGITPGATISYKYVHLSRQHYKACVRKGSGKGYICYGECTSVAGAVESAAADKIADSQPSFGLSSSANAASQASIDTFCSTDYVTIPQAVSAAIAIILNSNTVVSGQGNVLSSRFCGRYFQTATAAFASTSICSLAVPFELGVNMDDDEICTANTSGITCEFAVGAAISVTGAGGILGFSLCYTQTAV